MNNQYRTHNQLKYVISFRINRLRRRIIKSLVAHSLFKGIYPRLEVYRAGGNLGTRPIISH